MERRHAGTHYPKSLGEFQAWSAASSARAVVIREDGGSGTAGSCVLGAVAAHQ